MSCPTPLGIGVRTKLVFCDVMTGRDPAEGIIITFPPHRGPVTLTFDLHNCDFARGLPLARSLREKIDWDRVRKETADSPYAAAFLVLVERLGLASYDERQQA